MFSSRTSHTVCCTVMRPSRGSYSLAQAATLCSGTLNLTQNDHATQLNLSNIPITTCLHHYVGHYCSQTEKRTASSQTAGCWCAAVRAHMRCAKKTTNTRTGTENISDAQERPPKNVSSLQGTHLGYRNPGIPTEARGGMVELRGHVSNSSWDVITCCSWR